MKYTVSQARRASDQHLKKIPRTDERPEALQPKEQMGIKG